MTEPSHPDDVSLSRQKAGSDAALDAFLTRNPLRANVPKPKPLFVCYFHPDEEVFPTPQQKAELAEGRLIGLAPMRCIGRAREAAEK